MDFFWLLVSWAAFFSAIALFVIKVIFKKGIEKPISIPLKLLFTPFLLVFISFVVTRLIALQLDWDSYGRPYDEFNVPFFIWVLAAILIVEQVFLALKKFKFWKIWIFEIVLILMVPVYSAYCEYYWEKAYENYSYWGRVGMEQNIFFEPMNSDQSISLANYTSFEWERRLLDPYHGMYISEVHLSFPDDTTLVADREVFAIDYVYWTYPVFNNNLEGEKIYRDVYKFDPKKMEFKKYYRFEEESEFASIELIDGKLSIDYIF